MKTNIRLGRSQTQLTTLAAGIIPTNGHGRLSMDANPAVASFLAARMALEQHQRELENELADIQRILNGEIQVPVSTVAVPTPVQTSPPRRSNNGLTKAVSSLLANAALTKDQIVEKLKEQNFEFFGKPKSALDPVLYGKKFARDGKLFRLAVPNE